MEVAWFVLVSGEYGFWRVPGSWPPAWPGYSSEVMRVVVLGGVGSGEKWRGPALAGRGRMPLQADATKDDEVGTS